jgi:DNA-binding response OmpR family regulator
MPARVLVINDTQEILELFQVILAEEGYEVTLHTLGVDEMAEIRQIMPDLLLLDFVIGQETPGWQLLQKLKMDRATARIPVVVCSGAMRQLRELEGWLGAKGISTVLKPFDIDDLLITLRKRLIGASPALVRESARARPRTPRPPHAS